MADEQNIPKENKKIADAPVRHELKEEKKSEEKKAVDKKKEVKIPKPAVKKFEAVVNARSVHVSLKHAVAIGEFIKGKKISEAIANLERVSIKKQAVPFRGEIAHRKGKGMMSGKYPVNASKEFITLLKSLSANSLHNGMDLDSTIISSVVPNKAPEQVHRFGSTKFKRNHISITAKEVAQGVKK